MLDARTVRIDKRTAYGSGSVGTYALDDSGVLRVPVTVSTPTTFDVLFYGYPRQEDARGSVYVSAR